MKSSSFLVAFCWALLFSSAFLLKASGAEPPIDASEKPRFVEPRSVEAGSDSELVRQIDKLFADYPDATKPGGAVGVSRNGKRIYSRGFGAAHVGYEVANTPQTVFDVASASKAFTTACIALLMDQGKLKPDDDIRDIVTEMKDLPQPVRIRDLLRCETGIWAQVHIMPLTGRDNVPVQHPYSRDDLFSVLSAQRRLPFKPGTDHEYSSSDFFLLAMAVERVSEQRFPDFAKENLFQPCGMKRTFVEEQSQLSFKNRAVGHWDKSEMGLWRTWLPHSYAVGGGGLNTCIDDLFEWDAAMRNHLSANGNRLPRGKYMDEFVEQGCVLGNRFNLDAIAYGLRRHGPKVPTMKYRGARRIFFTGGYWGLNCCIARFPDHDFSVFCLSNNGDASALEIVRQIADLALADELEVSKETTLEKDDAANVSVEYIDAEIETLRKHVGAYRRGTKTIWTISLLGNGLHVTDHLGDTYELKPISPTLFQPVGKPFNATSRFEFQLGEDGLAKTMIQSWQNAGVRDVLKYDRVELADPSAPVAEFTGRYLSGELNLVYAFREVEGELWLRVGSRCWERLRSLVKDEFGPAKLSDYDQRIYRFVRNDDGEVDAVSVRFWRIRDLRLNRVKE